MHPDEIIGANQDLPRPTRVRIYAFNPSQSEIKPSRIDLTTVDVLVERKTAVIDEASVCQFVSVDAFLAELQTADVVANAIAGRLRVHLPSTQPRMPWICLAKVAFGVSTGDDIPTLAGLVTAFGAGAELEIRLEHLASDCALSEMWTAALALAALVRSGCPIRRQLLLSQVITPPYIDLPAVDNDEAWRYMPDDLLAGVQRRGSHLPDSMVARARLETTRRQTSGHVPDFRVINWSIPGVEPYS